MNGASRGTRSSPASLYVIILVAFQVFLLTVAAEAFFTDNEALAWSSAVVSVVMVAFVALFLRYLRP
jgi:hypothetical protein